MKKKMDFMTKAKLLYSGELALFAIAFLTIATLEFTKVIKISDKHHTIFNWVTMFGATWLIIDFLWALLSPKRRKRIAIIDKIIVLPVAVYLISFDLFCLITKPTNQLVYQYGIPAVLAYLGLAYTFEAIYHFKYPVPGLLDIEEKAKEEEKQDSPEIVSSENVIDAEFEVKDDEGDKQ